MSFCLCNSYSINEEKSNTISIKNKVGKERIYKLNENENLQEYDKYFSKEESSELFSTNKIQEKYNMDLSIFKMKNPYICIFCGFEFCKWENPNIRKDSDIHGLLADLYFDCVYACQRPSTCLIKQYNLLQVFKRKKIKLIVNCQVNGEHPYCGPNKELEEDCGFSYSPAAFIAEGIEVLCKGFKDLTPPDTLDFILEVVRRMAYVVKYKKGKVLVHCHAGNGRTGIVLVCFFMFYFNKSYNEALTELRKKRKKGVEKVTQEIFCQKFEAYIQEIKNFFPIKSEKIHFFVKNQKILDYNFDKTITPSIIVCYYLKDIKIDNMEELYKKIIDIDFIPKIIFECIEKIVELKNFYNIPLKELYLILNGMNKLSQDTLNEIKTIKNELTVNNWDNFNNVKDISIISELLFIWMNSCVYNCIEPKKIESIIKYFIFKFLPQQKISESNISKDNSINILTDFSNLNNLFNIIDNKENNNSIIFNQMLCYIKNELSKLEYETIKYISVFLQILYPTNKLNFDFVDINSNNNMNINIIQEYKRFIYKLCLFLLGYNLDNVNYNLHKFENSNELLHSKMLIFIFELFIFFQNNGKDVNIFDNNENYQKNEDIFFKYKNKNGFISIKDYL